MSDDNLKVSDDAAYRFNNGFAPAPTSDEGTPTHLLTDERTGQVGVDAGLLKKVGRDMYEVVGNAHAPTGDASSFGINPTIRSLADDATREVTRNALDRVLGTKDTPAPTGHAYEDAGGLAKPGCTVAHAPDVTSEQIGEIVSGIWGAKKYAPAPAVGEVTFADARPFDPGLCVALGETVTRETIRTIGSAIAAARAEERKECWHKEFETRGIIAEAVRKEERERVWKLAYASTRNSYSKDSPQVGELGFRMIEIVNAGIIQGQVIKAALADGIDLTSLPKTE